MREHRCTGRVLCFRNTPILLLLVLTVDSIGRTSAGSNPCQDYSLHDCDPVAECNSDLPGYFQCRCPKGFADVSPDKTKNPGRKCQKEENECSLGTHECDANAECVDTSEGYSCRCKPGWADVSANTVAAPGRNCKRTDLCKAANCAPEAECREGPNGAECQCTSGYVDVSRLNGRPTGYVCRPITNECSDGKHDCAANAHCIDTAEAFTCRCHDGYRDDSQNIQDRPGRICTKAAIPEAPECDVNDPMSCNKDSHEVCIFKDGNYKCACPKGYNKLPDGRCLAINECENSRLNNCSLDADCIDQAEGYSCRCRSGFADVSGDGRVCRRRVNECAQPKNFGVDCDMNAVCVDTEESYSCRCRPGFADVSETFNSLPGRKCVEAINECLDKSLNDCSEDAICEDAKEGYICTCRPGFVDASSVTNNYPGRVCNKPHKEAVYPGLETSIDSCNPQNPSNCGPNSVCTDKNNKGEFVCDCAPGAIRYYGGQCRQVAACQSDADCDKNAVCSNIFDSFICQCRPGYYDNSPDPETRPGRSCKELVNECSNGQHTCSPFAECVDATDGYACVCGVGFVDTSSQYGLPPGRKCSNENNECAEKALNTCDENADCIDTPDSYACQCFSGYIDVSSNAHLPPGRVCTVQTTCPKQKTDLIFLIDGSGSIGSYVFKNEVLRFVRDFLELFDVGLDNTRVGLIQYSDQIRHEFDLKQHLDKQSLLKTLSETQYLTGLTRTGAAIQHMVVEGFSERRGARPISGDVSRVAIVITDGRSQDNVTEPAKSARDQHVNTFSIGVTDHVLASELEAIAGSPNRWFYVDRFKDLDMRLRSLIQKLACPTPERPERPSGVCNPDSQTGCDRTRNEMCVLGADGKPKCQCPNKFQRHPITHICGGDLCNPEIPTSCQYPDTCEPTPFGNHRCVCPDKYSRDMRTGVCLSTIEQKQPASICKAGLEQNPRTGKCVVPGSCDPTEATPCDVRKREKCLLHPSANYHTCQCGPGENRHPVTEICLTNECNTGDNDCAPTAKCVDTDSGYLCSCPPDAIDSSPDLANRPGRICSAASNECVNGANRCSPDAICTDTYDGYICRCKSGFVDFSPNLHKEPGVVCKPEVNECANKQLNTCHKDALCIDTVDSYKCICKAGFTDLDELRNPGRQCQRVDMNDRCDVGKNDCDRNAKCVQKAGNDFTCFCPPGFRDQSPDKVNKPGRVCIPLIHECDNPTLNDCDLPDRAICTDTDEGYLCRCRQGFLDISPNSSSKPGRICKALINECVKGTHDCAPIGGICEDTPDSYTCRCAINHLDVSPDPRNRPGRNCKKLVNECLNGQNDCAGAAICTDTEDSYTCKCPATGYMDKSPDLNNKPGRVCIPIINECEAPNLNDCHRNAECIDLPGGYECKCKSPYVDQSPPDRKGRICLYNECSDPKANKCDPNAECIDTEDSYLCRCKAGFYDESSNRLEQGRVCIELSQDPLKVVTVPKLENPDAIPCGLTECKLSLNEVCVGGARCACRPGEGRASNSQKCQPIDKTPLAVRVVSRNGQPIFYSSDFGRNENEAYVEFANEFQPDLGRAVGGTEFAPRYVNTDVSYITHPKTVNSSWPDGLLVNFTVGTIPSKTPVDKCELWKQLMDSFQRSNNAIGGGRLNVAADVNLLDPCAKPPPKGETCGGVICNADLGEVCLGEQLCGCGNGEKRGSTKDHCRPVESWQIPLWVIRNGQKNLVFNETFSNPQDDLNKAYVKSFEGGVAECYPHTELKNAFVSAEVNEIVDPMAVNASWDTGLLFNSTMHFRKGSVKSPPDAYNALVRYIIDKNNYQVGHSGLYLNPYQPDPFKACYKNNCHPKGICIDLGPNAFRCECSSGYRDMNPADPGRMCLPTKNYNECERKEDNVCSENARCIDLEYLYKCECVNGFSDASPKGAVPGSVCVLDYCSDVNFCTINSTCVNTEHQAECQCKQGFVDIRKSERRLAIGMNPDAYCLNRADVDWCLLGLHNCSGLATCTNQRGGYTCACPSGYVDGNPSQPGRVCAALLCDLCHQHGDCVHNPLTNNVTCACTEGYTGEFCELAPSAAPLILLIFLALLFLLLTLCCLLYLCTKCHCFKRQARAFPWSTLDQSASSDSGADFSGSELYIPRAKLKPSENADANAQQLAQYLDEGLRIPRARLHDTSSLGSGSSEFTIREEIERRVITDVTRTELHTITTDENVHNELNETVSSSAFHSSNVAGGGSAAAAAASSYHDNFRAGAHFDEQERGESVAEFANSRSGGAAASEWRERGGHVAGDGGFGAGAAESAAFSSHAHQYSGEHQDDRSIGDFTTTHGEDDGGIYDKSVAMNRHHELDPATGVERFRNEMTTKKNYSETYHK